MATSMSLHVAKEMDEVFLNSLWSHQRENNEFHISYYN